MAAARVEVANLQPVVSHQQPDLPGQRHRLPHVGEKGSDDHRLSLSSRNAWARS